MVQNNDYKQSLRTLLTDYQGDVTDEEIETITSSSMAMSSLEKASDTRKNNKAKDMADYLNAVGGVADTQRTAVAKYQLEFRNFMIDPEADLTALNEAATAAFTKPTFSVREHLMRLYEGQKELADSILGDNQFSMSVSNDLLQSQNMLLAGNESMGIKGMFDYKYDAYRSVRHHEFDMMRLDHLERKEHWQSQMRAILARGQMEWRDGEKRLKGRYDEWTENVRREYKNKKESWDDKYLDFLDDKNTWLNVVSEQSTKIGDMSVLENFGDITQAAISDAGKDVIITTLSETAPDPSEILEEVVDMDLLDKLLENAESLNRGIKFFKPVIFTQLDGDKYTTAELMQSIKDFQGLQNEDYKKHVTKMEYQKMMDRLDAAEKNLEKQVDSANRGIDSSLHETMRKDGYILSGNVYKRDLIVGSTVIDGMLFETGYVNAYSDFTDFKVDFTSSVELTDDELDNMTSDALDGLLDRAMQDIAKETKSIFGDAEDSSTILADAMGLDKNGNYVDHGDDKDAQKAAREADDKDDDESDNDPSYEFIQEIKWMEEITEQVSTRIVKEQSGNGVVEREVPVYATRYEERSATRGVDASPGKFGSHVGYQPAFVDDVDFDKSWSDNVRFQGHGQMGTIMGQYIFNKMKEGMGIAMCNRPSYDQKFWDDRGDWLEAPTYRGTVDMVTSVVSVVAPGPGLALSLAADAAFTVADVSNGVMSWEEGALSFGKSAAISIGSKFIPGVDKIPGLENIGDTVAGAIVENVANQVVNNTFAGAINAINFENGWDFNTFSNSVVGDQALMSYATGAISTGVTEGISRGFAFDNKGFDVSESISQEELDLRHKQIRGLGSTLGTMAASGFEMAVTGETTLNVLALSDLIKTQAVAGSEDDGTYWGGVKNRFTSSSGDIGLFEIDLKAGKDGLSSKGRFGTSGHKLNTSSILTAIKGVDAAKNNVENQAQIDEAYEMSQYISSINDRVINRSETALTTEGILANTLSNQIEARRSAQSRSNLYTLFTEVDEAGDRVYSESHIDNNLRLAFDQEDLSVEELLGGNIGGHSVLFDTNGSFDLGYDLYKGNYENKGISLEEFMNSGLAHAGKVDTLDARNGNHTKYQRDFDRRNEIFSEYYKDDLEKFDTNMDGTRFSSSLYLSRRIHQGRTREIGGDLTLMNSLFETIPQEEGDDLPSLVTQSGEFLGGGVFDPRAHIFTRFNQDRLTELNDDLTQISNTSRAVKDFQSYLLDLQNAPTWAKRQAFGGNKDVMFNAVNNFIDYYQNTDIQLNFGNIRPESQGTTTLDDDTILHPPVAGTGSFRITTVEGVRIITTGLQAAFRSNPDLGSASTHVGFWDIGTGEPFLSPVDGSSLDLSWGAGLEVTVGTDDYSYTHGHSTISSLNLMLQTVIVSGGFDDIGGGMYVGQSAGAPASGARTMNNATGATTGAHTHLRMVVGGQTISYGDVFPEEGPGFFDNVGWNVTYPYADTNGVIQGLPGLPGDYTNDDGGQALYNYNINQGQAWAIERAQNEFNGMHELGALCDSYEEFQDMRELYNAMSPQQQREFYLQTIYGIDITQ